MHIELNVNDLILENNERKINEILSENGEGMRARKPMISVITGYMSDRLRYN